MAARPTKRVRLEQPAKDADASSEHSSEVFSEQEATASEDEDSSGEETGVTDEEDAIRTYNEQQHGVKPKKRRRALSPEAFGARLQDLLAAPAPTTKELSRLHRPARKAQNEEAVERKALRLVQASKHASRDRGHVTDIIPGWSARPAVPFKDWPSLPLEELEAPGGAEAEKVLRRLAQKGVVKLFNAIRAAQTTSTAGVSNASNASVTSKKRKAIMPPVAEQNDGVDKKIAAAEARRGPNLLGTKGKEQTLANLSRESFLSILKSGGTNKSSIA